MCSLRFLGACRGMDISSNKNVVVIVFLHRIVSELPGVLKSVGAVFRALFTSSKNHFLSTCTKVQIIPQPLEILFQYETLTGQFSFSSNLPDFERHFILASSYINKPVNCRWLHLLIR